ncbi:MAG: DNA polymerase [Clostridia bacterium]|nr:DNA polymerase [Clostridia bacterium]
MNTLNIDLETRSGADISKTGVYRYAEDENFDILLFGVSVDHGPIRVYDLACGETVPEEILAALSDNSVTKYAYNASFERVCLSVWLRRYYPRYFKSCCPEDDPASGYLDPSAWRCSMVLAYYNGLPGGLDKVGAVLGFEQQKLKEGKDLIRYFCQPCRPTKSNGGRTWNLPQHAPGKWELFKRYNERDVLVEQQIQDRLRKYPVPDFVWEEYVLDQKINDRGIRIDRQMVAEALEIDDLSKADLTAKMKKMTGLENPNSVMQMQGYLAENGLEMETLAKKEVAAAIKTAPENLAEVLSLRLQLAKSSVKKYQAMENSVCGDGRCHGMFQFLGAGRTGRWAGRLIQLQNLPQNKMPDLEQARALVKQGDYEMLNMLYPSVPGVLSELIRTSFIPREGYRFIVADYSAIEARVLSHLAGEKWRAEVFRTGGDIYCASASQMFKVPVEKHGVNGHLRQKGKIAELALGYGGSVGALKAMGAIDMGLEESELQPLVSMWRDANPHIVQYWWKIDEAIKETIQMRVSTEVGCVRFEYVSRMLFIHLPSGRRLSYIKPRLEPNQYGGESITYLGPDANKHWGRIESYGPKFVENIVQAVSRDILAAAMKRLKDYRIVGHVHDEVIIEAPAEVELSTVCAIMGQTPEWLPGILLRADGYECAFYKKD